MLIAFNLPRKEMGISVAEASKIYRELYGYNSHSFYGKYNRKIGGLLDELGGVLKLSRSQVLLVRKEEGERVVDFLRQRRANVFNWVVDLTVEEDKGLEPRKG